MKTNKIFKNVSIRLRITIVTVSILTVCCVGLTLILNFSANNIVKKIEAVKTFPAYENGSLEVYIPHKSQVIDTTPITEAGVVFRKESILYLFLIVAVGGAMTYFITGKSLKPLNDLNRQVKKINANNLSENLKVPPTRDEISELTNSFNEMTDKLQNVFLTQQNFSASAAHELKTPLTILQAKVDVFKMNASHTPEEYDSIIDIFQQQIKRLSGLVGSLLNMTNLDDYFEKSIVYLKDVVEDIVSELSMIAKNKNISVTLKGDDSTAFGNTDLIYRAFYNVIENAIKYNIDGGKVDISIRKSDENRVSVKVLDTGIGIPNDMKKHIFEPFYRVDKSRSRAMGGAGLGLSTAHNIVKKHDGSILVYDNENGGSCFEIILKSC